MRHQQLPAILSQLVNHQIMKTISKKKNKKKNPQFLHSSDYLRMYESKNIVK